MNLGDPNLVSTASVPMERPGRYGKQLVSHMSRRSGGAWDEESGNGWIQLGETGRAEVVATEGALELQVSAPDHESLSRLEGAVGRHLVRFAAKEELTVSWTHDHGTPGTVQRFDDPQPPVGPTTRSG